MTEINYFLILTAAFFAVASPGPATLAIAGTSMSQGRLKGAILALGITTGSLFWSLSAALGLSEIMTTNVILFEVVRYLGAFYLLFMAYKSGRAALFSHKKMDIQKIKPMSLSSAYYKGIAIHITNPKAILFFGSLYAVAIPIDSTLQDLMTINALIVGQGFIVFQCYAYLFSISKVRDFYLNMRKWFEALFALTFASAGIKILTLKLE